MLARELQMQLHVPPQLLPVAYVVRPRTPEGRHALSNTFYSPSSTRFEEECLFLEREVSLRQSNDVARVNRLHLVTPGPIGTPENQHANCIRPCVPSVVRLELLESAETEPAVANPNTHCAQAGFRQGEIQD